MKNLFKITYVLLLSVISSSCRENIDNNLLGNNIKESGKTEAKIIEGMINAKSQMKSLVFQPNNSSGKSVINLKEIENKYRSNLDLINRETGLNLKYDEKEFNAMLSSLEGNFLENGFIISNKKYSDNIERIKSKGSEQLFNETNEVLKKLYNNPGVYTQSTTARSGISRGCALSLAGNFVATLGLSACATGVGCPLAIAGKVLAMASVADSCLS